MKTVRAIRKVASLLLLVCLVVPLSRCDGTPFSEYAENEVGVETQIAVEPTISHTEEKAILGYETIVNSVKFGEAHTYSDYAEGILSLFLYVILFLGPVMFSTLKDRSQSILTLLSTFPAGFCIYIHVQIMQPLIGAWLCLISWVALSIASVFILVRGRNS